MPASLCPSCSDATSGKLLIQAWVPKPQTQLTPGHGFPTGPLWRGREGCVHRSVGRHACMSGQVSRLRKTLSEDAPRRVHLSGIGTSPLHSSHFPSRSCLKGTPSNLDMPSGPPDPREELRVAQTANTHGLAYPRGHRSRSTGGLSGKGPYVVVHREDLQRRDLAQVSVDPWLSLGCWFSQSRFTPSLWPPMKMGAPVRMEAPLL